ncbi:MAG: hypothetical protein LBT80_05680 [Lactobacillaceae bacterium]|jgi:hypothetical protein|nr:hypothetical protein [Lactobacillaceae bacterium]
MKKIGLFFLGELTKINTASKYVLLAIGILFIVATFKYHNYLSIWLMILAIILAFSKKQTNTKPLYTPSKKVLITSLVLGLGILIFSIELFLLDITIYGAICLVIGVGFIAISVFCLRNKQS